MATPNIAALFTAFSVDYIPHWRKKSDLSG
ncbi:hypothetical protein COLO4_24993 [Corchorus olitorius]|uniref:Uncharacterized protein n=1 Tax=Corchorus olitorius TaxID=93759 RepID=A0A1R3I5N3_9ROSI|nr:hypothetical protein COLO4_24993 [Corchorus olitorius]